jgi:curved DNA-binding protein CbpA
VATLYEELGVRPDASADELRRAYRSRARQLHPDLHIGGDDPEAAAEGMTRLNSAWRVLSDPEARRRYDLELALANAQARAARLVDEGSFEERFRPPLPAEAALPRPKVRARVWALVLAVLMVIFVLTAYAANRPAPGQRGGRPGECLSSVPGLDAYVSCTQPNLGKLVTEVGPDEPCPTQPPSFRHLIASRNRVACLTRT